MDKNDGGWAFPCSVYDGKQAGMSLRDWYAGMALTGILPTAKASGPEGFASLQETVAGLCYSMADAMLKARGQ